MADWQLRNLSVSCQGWPAGACLQVDTSSHQLRLSRCPGVFKTAQTGCGAPLRPWARSVTLEDGRAHVFEFWACEGAGCDFREVLPSRLKAPQLALEAVSAAEGFQVRATAWCHPCTT